MNTNIKKFTFAAVLVMALFAPIAAFAQATVTTTTTSAAVSLTTTTVTVASATGISGQSNNNQGTEIFMDREAMRVVSVTSTTLRVIRGVDGTVAAPHVSGVTVYAGPSASVSGPGPFWQSDPAIGGCTATAELYSLRINTQAGRIWQCSNGQWTNVIDAFLFVSPTACNSSVSGNSTGTNGYTVLGTAPSIPVVNAQTSNSGTNTHYFMCNIPLPSRYAAAKAAYVVDVEFYYGVQTTGLGTQVATLSSGTMNSKTVFTYIDYPVAAASETATGLAEATRADAGTLTITPVVASSNVATTTAGEFYSAKFTPANPIAMATNRRQLLFTASLLNTATSATVTNSPGILVHYRILDAGF